LAGTKNQIKLQPSYKKRINNILYKELLRHTQETKLNETKA